MDPAYGRQDDHQGNVRRGVGSLLPSAAASEWPQCRRRTPFREKIVSPDLHDDAACLTPVALPPSVTEREAAEFAEGLAILDDLVTRLRAYAEDIEAPVRNRP